MIDAPIERCFDLSRSIEVHLLGTEQTGEQAVGGVTSGLIELGEFVRWRAKHFGVTQHLASRITAYDRPAYFQDTMVEGAFRSMQHDHFFKALAPDRTEMTDRFVLAAPLPVLGLIAEKLVLRRYMRNLLTHRNELLKQVAEADQWKSFLPG
ncbi:SRPBCC family protein [Terriglobus sp.]|uniref:SRPBCC family protein n=1 Tax=Terriglobus sp. TaxID=1889013 RepID=UPI003AFF81DB